MGQSQLHEVVKRNKSQDRAAFNNAILQESERKRHQELLMRISNHSYTNKKRWTLQYGFPFMSIKTESLWSHKINCTCNFENSHHSTFELRYFHTSSSFTTFTSPFISLFFSHHSTLYISHHFSLFLLSLFPQVAVWKLKNFIRSKTNLYSTMFCICENYYNYTWKQL